MEVHKHPHHVTHKKKWTEYLLEFFMLFLAVFLGFVAENIREGYVDKRKEKDFMYSYMRDLRADTSNIKKNLELADLVSKKTDSLLDIINSGKTDSTVTKLYRLVKETQRVVGVIFDDRTTPQLKTSGILLIHNDSVADLIEQYWGRRKVVEGVGERLSEIQDKASDIAAKLFNNKYYLKPTPDNPFPTSVVNDNTQLISNDPNLIIQYSNQKAASIGVLYNYIKRMKDTKNDATHLIQLIKKEYHLQNE